MSLSGTLSQFGWNDDAEGVFGDKGRNLSDFSAEDTESPDGLFIR